MSDGPIKGALAALSRHAPIVELLAEGGTVLQDAVAKPAASALLSASALRSAGEDSWRLHPRLREYLQDHLQLVTPFQSLKEVGQAIASLGWLRDELDTAARERDMASFDSLLARTSSTIYDIADATESNLGFLTGMVSLKYGAAQTVAAKISENRWYERQATVLAADLTRLGHRAEELVRHAEERRWDLAPLIRRAILVRMSTWQSELSEVLTRLRTDVFLLREVEKNLRNLARADAYMAQQPSWRGPETDLPAGIPDVLLRAAPARLRAHVEPNDDFSVMRQDIETLVASLPPRRVREPKQEAQAVQVRRAPSKDQPAAILDVYAATLQQLKVALLDSHEPISLVRWHAEDSGAAALRPPSPTALKPGSWLMLAVCALADRPHRVGGQDVSFEVQLLKNPPAPGRRYPNTFRDATVRVRQGALRLAGGAGANGASAT